MTTGNALTVVIVIKTNVGAMWIVPHIEEMRRRGHRPVVVLPGGDGALRARLDELGVPLRDSAFDFRFRPTPRTVLGLRGLRRQIDELAPDVVHYHLFASALAARLATLRRPSARVHMVAGPLYLDSRVIRVAERRLARLDTVLIAGSEHTADRYRALCGARPPVTTIAYALPEGRFAPATADLRDEARAAWGFADDEVVMTMVALVYPPRRLVHAGRGIKGHDVLLEAWRTVSATRPQARLLLVGGGYGEAGERHRDELRLRFGVDDDPSVTWLLTTPDVRQAYAAADVSVSPSLSENHGAAREASASGVPSVVSDAGGLPETVDQRTGWIVPKGDVVALADRLVSVIDLGRETLRERGELAAAREAEQFDPVDLAHRVVDEIEGAAERRADGRHHHPQRLGPWRRGVRGDAQASMSVPVARPVTVFSESRFITDADGIPYTEARSVAGWSWCEHLSHVAEIRLAGRASRGDTTGLDRVHGDFVPLPPYVGAAGLLRRLPGLVLELRRITRESSTVIIKQPGIIGVIVALFARPRRQAVVVQVVGDIEEVLRSGIAGRTGRMIARPMGALARRCVRRGDVVRYVTQHDLQGRYPAGSHATSISFSDVATDPARRRAREPDTSTVISVGSQENAYKGHEHLLSAVAMLASQQPDLRLVLVGGGRHQHELRRAAEELGIIDRVTFTGHIADRAALVSELDAAMVFALPSLTEGMPRALIEAMARGLPCVATSVGGIPELLDSHWCVPPRDATALATRIAELLADPGLRAEAGQVNAQRAEDFDGPARDRALAEWQTAVLSVTSGVLA